MNINIWLARSCKGSPIVQGCRKIWKPLVGPLLFKDGLTRCLQTTYLSGNISWYHREQQSLLLFPLALQLHALLQTGPGAGEGVPMSAFCECSVVEADA